MTGGADCFGIVVCVMGDMVGLVAGTGLGGIEGGDRTANLRTKRPSTRVKGIYFGKLGLRRRALWAKIIRGVRPAIITWFP
jgi:hypothetical protein